MVAASTTVAFGLLMCFPAPLRHGAGRSAMSVAAWSGSLLAWEGELSALKARLGAVFGRSELRVSAGAGAVANCVGIAWMTSPAR